MKQAITEIIKNTNEFSELVRFVRKGELPCSVFGVTQNAKTYFVSALKDSYKHTVLCVTATEQSAYEYANVCGEKAVFFPDDEMNLRQTQAKSREGEMERIRVLKNSTEHGLVFLSVKAAMARVIPKKDFLNACLMLRVGNSYNMQELLVHLANSGYERAGTVYSKGQYAKRGEILDVFPSDTKTPLRITFFDDEIESIRHFDIDSQKSDKRTKAESFLLPPAREVVINSAAKDNIMNFLKTAEEGELKDNIAYEIQEYGASEMANTLLPVLYEKASLFDYFKKPLVVFDDFERINQEADNAYLEFGREHSKLSAEKEVFDVQKDAMLPLKDVIDTYESCLIDMAGFSGEKLKTVNSVDMKLSSAAGFLGRMELLANSLAERMKHGYKVYLFAGEKASTLFNALQEKNIVAPVINGIEGNEKIAILQDQLSYGFEIKTTKTLVLGTNDIFGRIKKHTKSTAKKNVGEDIFSDLKPNDFVVHEVHGKGRYLGLKTISAGGSVAEYMEIEYRGGDKLYIPTAQIDRVQKYIGAQDEDVQLSKLGGKEWENTKAKVRESALKLAFDLIDLYASRFSGDGYMFSQDTVWQKQFEEAFEFEETPGQLSSIEQIKKDMESKKVMDRLLLGDVGYGKTEVAMRAAFKAVMDGKQVAVLVPTTLLARQHKKTFIKRFSQFPVTIEGLSRFSKTKNKQIISDMKNGKIDIVIGTHRLLSNDIDFSNLGLLIIDEEQRFGVNHKEKIKTMKESVDVLTLSATPIPRTLEMSLTGIRDLSTIDTPPKMRVEAYTYVMKYTEGLVRDAIMREINRGGQVYFVCRQIRQMDSLVRDVLRNVPNARVATAHGKLTEQETDRVVGGFIEGEYDVLICTTIIESGIDIPNVNTIIVYEADKFGLSQLYQLKGRVGRKDTTSYAYFTYLGDNIIKENASKRLAAIREFTQLGSGFKIAMRDLQIRGAGNLLGPEQSGHLASVGYAMYCKLMSEAVKIAKGQEVLPEFETSVELQIPAYIPDTYMKDQADKMDIYRLIGNIKNLSDAKEAKAEIEDRCGKLPIEVNNLILAAVIKGYAAAAGFASVIKKPDCIELKYSEMIQPNMKKLLKIIDKHEKNVILRASNPPAVVYKTNTQLIGKAFLKFLAGLKVARM